MDYQKIYGNIIEKARSENRIKTLDNYYEKHHINPRSLGGGNEDENLILLTAKEHFVCHKLLTKIYPNSREMATAFHFMVYGNNDYKNSARDYEYARELLSRTGLSESQKEKISIANKGKTHTIESRKKMSLKLKGKDAPNKGKKMSEEQKDKIRKAMLGKNKGGTRIISKETRKKMSEARKGKKLSEKTRKKMSEARKGMLNPMSGKFGENNPNYNSKRSEETKKKIGDGNRGKKRTAAHIEKYKLINKGRKMPEETKKKISESLKKRNSLKY